MDLKRAAWIVLFLILSVGAAFAFWIYRQRNALYSDPGRPRTNLTYTQVFSPAKATPAMPTNFFGNLTIETNRSQIQIKVPQVITLQDEQYLPFTLHRANGTEPLEIGGGKIELIAIQTGWTNAISNNYSEISG